VVEIPGVAGGTGPAGAAGSSGGNAFATFASAALTLPSAKNGTSSVLLSDIRWVQVGQIVFASDGTYAGTFKVNSATYTNQSSGVGGTAVLQWLQATGDASANQQFGAGTLVPAGYPGAAGTNGTNGFTVAGANNNNSGTQALTATPAQALSVGLTLPNSILISGISMRSPNKSVQTNSRCPRHWLHHWLFDWQFALQSFLPAAVADLCVGLLRPFCGFEQYGRSLTAYLVSDCGNVS
jgi:hypothetical protein